MLIEQAISLLEEKSVNTISKGLQGTETKQKQNGHNLSKHSDLIISCAK